MGTAGATTYPGQISNSDEPLLKHLQGHGISGTPEGVMGSQGAFWAHFGTKLFASDWPFLAGMGSGVGYMVACSKIPDLCC